MISPHPRAPEFLLRNTRALCRRRPAFSVVSALAVWLGRPARCTCRRTSGFSASRAMACVTPMSVVFLEQAVGQVGELKLRGVCGLPRPPRRRPCPQRASAMEDASNRALP